jgi:phage baseplate assembly protein W
MKNPYIGQGIIFPFQLSNGKLPIKSGSELIKSNMGGLLAFELHTRFMRGELGHRLRTLLSEQPLGVLKQTIGYFVGEVVSVYEPRLKFISEKTHINVNQLTGKVEAKLFFVEVSTKTEYSFVLPFYKTPKPI